ncbi:MAG: nucleotidyltransferase substrate binding protein [Candidatus Omnitrophota bacterium]|nr:nucleotidyltransferase substrate binding protein [Candidatus Omnitrophota bacterium]
MSFDLSSLQKAVGSLERAVKVASYKIKGKVNTDEEEVVRAGVIQNFEFTYELCWKFMKRWLTTNIGSAIVDGVSRKELFRMAAESRLIANVEAWFEYHNLRNETAHTYNAKTAEDVYETAICFLADARAFLEVLEDKND